VAGWFTYEAERKVALADGSGPAVFFTRAETSVRKPKRFSESDVFEMALEGILALSCILTPQSAWAHICGGTSRLRKVRHISRRRPHFLFLASRILSEKSPQELNDLYDQYRARLHQRRMSMLREHVRPGEPQFDFVGREHLDAAVRQGRGAILWAGQFSFQTVTGKRGLAEAGFDTYQVSAVQHGFSHTQFGQTVLNRPLVAAENRYLKGRLVFKPGEAAQVLRRAMTCLRNGEIVIFTNNLLAGRHFVQLPFGEGVWTAMPVTPLRLALRHGIPLFHVATLQTVPFRNYEIRISPNLATGLKGETGYDAMAQLASKARDLTLEQVRAFPDQYIGWPTLMPNSLFSASGD